MIKAQVVWSDEALTDLEIIYDFISIKSQAAAQRIIEAILSRTKQLETFPESGVEQQNIRSRKVYRFLVEGNYKIIYSFKPEFQTIYIEIIFDTRNDPEKLIK